MKVFLTGGNGFIGSHVLRKLVARGDSVRCLVRETSDLSRIEHVQGDWERFVGDVRDQTSMTDAATGCDAIIHLASPSSWDDIVHPAMNDIVFGGTRHVLQAALQNGNIRVVYCSTIIAINGTDHPVMIDEDSSFTLNDQTLVYAMSKHQAEEMCQEAITNLNQDIVIVNPVEVYGPEDTSLVTAGNLIDFATSWPVMVSRGGTSIVHVEDVADGIIAALDRGIKGKRYILGGDNLTIEDLAKLTLELLGKKAPVVTMPTSVLRGASWLGTTLKIPLPFNPLVIPYATRYWMADNRLAKDELKVHFRGARETLRPTLDWLVESGHLPKPS